MVAKIDKELNPGPRFSMLGPSDSGEYLMKVESLFGHSGHVFFAILGR